MLKLVKLSTEYKNQFMDMMDEWTEDIRVNKGNNSPWAIFRNDYHDFENYLTQLEHTKEEDGMVQDSVWFLYDDETDRFIGASNIRHYMNPGLYQTGGHIGDGIRPGERKKGYGTKIISLSLQKCKELGIEQVLITCSKSNIGSAKTITNNGGVLENEVDEDGDICQRYWINLHQKGTQPKEFYSERLHFRPIAESDTETIFRNWTSDPMVSRYLTWNAHESVETTRKIVNMWLSEYKEEKTFRYGIELCDSHELIGMIDIVKWVDDAPEIGYVLSQKYWGKGYMSEAFAKVIEILKEMGIKKIVMSAKEDNIASNHIIMKNGFRLVGKKPMILPLKNNETMICNWYERDLSNE